MRNRISSLTIGCTLAAISAAAEGITNPVTGYVFDPAQGVIRPINGLPGAALLGPALESPVEFSRVAFAPGHRRALAVSRDGESFLLEFNGNTVASRAIGQPAPELVAFDRAGRWAVLESANRVRILSPEGTLGDALPVPGIGGEIAALAIDNTGKTLAVAASVNAAVSVYIWQTGASQAEFVTDAAGVESLAFSSNGQLAIADRLSNRVLVAGRSAAGNWQVEVAAAANDGLSAPAAAQFDDSGALVMISSGSGEVLIRTSDGIARLKLDSPAAGLEPMASRAMHLVPARGVVPGAALHLLDMERSARIVFVPAGGNQ